ncbi:MAG: hypothetical protein ACOZNI_21765 [Myxococcota bacterium]
MLIALLTACSEPAPPPEKKEDKSACDVDVTKLQETSWLWLDPNAGDKPNPIARLKFVDEGGTIHGKYTAKSLGDVYDYTCALNGKILTCVETDPHAEAFCKAWAATHDGVCDPAGVAAATGIPQAEFDKVAEKVNGELKKLKGEEKANQRKADNSPNNKIRGKFLVAVDKSTCRLTVQDKYQTLVDGKLNEFENVLGTAKFEKAKEEYIWESCKDADSAWAPSAADADKHEAVQPAGTVKFSAILQKDQKGAAGCTYTADIWKDWVKYQPEVPATDDPKWGPRFDVSIPLTEPGRHAVYFDRYKTCDGKKDRIGLTCAVVRIE